MQHEHENVTTDQVQLPSPTVWPMVMALGVSLVVGGMVTSIYVGALGFVLTVLGIVGWFLQVLPHEVHEAVEVSMAVVPVSSVRTLMRPISASASRRKILPVETFRISSGIKGGIAGGIAMTVPAGIFSVIKYHSFWYAVNLLAAGGFLSWAGASNAFLGEFHLRGLLAATVIHGLTSLLVGLLYGALLYMFPKYPILSAGFLAPFLFTAILYTALGIVSPILNQRIDWLWFVISQIFFGLVCGFVVNLEEKVRTPQFQALPFAVRAGFHGDMALLVPEEYVDERPSDDPEKKDTSK